MRNRQSGYTGRDMLTILMGLAVVLGIAFALGRGCFVSEEDATEAVEKQGYRVKEVVDKDVLFVGWRGCSDNDAAGFDMKVVNPAGQETEIKVCCGAVFKGCTVRTR